MISSTGRYSGFLRPATYVLDLIVIIYLARILLSLDSCFLYYSIFIAAVWIMAALKLNFYEVYRFTPLIKIFSLVAGQSIVFGLAVYAFFGWFNTLDNNPLVILKYLGSTIGIITLIKLAIYQLLKKYRVYLGGNYRKVIIIGQNSKMDQLGDFFVKNPAYGYKLERTFNLHQADTSLEECFHYIISNSIDEVYCSISELSNEEVRELTDFTDNNLKILKFIPDNKEIFTKKLNYQYYGITPVLSLRDIPIDIPINQFIKRTFDIILSLLVLIGLLSWLTPILAILIRTESKGSTFFKQKRNGLDYKEFYCYKFRSMVPNATADLHQVRKNDERITNMGKFLRKTSLDELPQFINVLKGEMSVVGPRPHMVSHTHMYAERIDKFMVRHFIKPGITGLAQISGYRGEVENDNDIINRVKFDIFYVENWSLLLDLRIVAKTIVNTIKGDKKAY